MWLSVLPRLMAITDAQNVSEIALFGPDYSAVRDLHVDLPPLMKPAMPEPTFLPETGIVATIGPNETHTYFLNISSGIVNESLSLSECVRSPISEMPLTLTSNEFTGDTGDGGLLFIDNFTDFSNIIKVQAPKSTNSLAQWSYEIGYDNTASYSSDSAGIFLVDADFSSSLFVTGTHKSFTRYLNGTPYRNLINETFVNFTTPNYNLFLHNVNETASQEFLITELHRKRTSLLPLSKSFCAVKRSALLNQNNAEFSTTNRNTNKSETSILRGQFLFTGLNKSTMYEMQLGIPPSDGAVGGMIFSSVPFRTKDSTSCQLIYSMPMCPNTAFTVPGNASIFTHTELANIYNNYVEQHYRNFTKALDQINCNTTRKDEMFSVYSTCDDCANAYLDWLCTVSVPRCDDWSNNASYLIERDIGTSRNKLINEVIQPGRYKEVLPCYWLCNNLLTYCPISMKFHCPSGRLLNNSYGWPSDNGDISCSYPGAMYDPDSSWLNKPSWCLLILAMLSLML